MPLENPPKHWRFVRLPAKAAYQLCGILLYVASIAFDLEEKSMSIEETKKPTKSTSARKVEANRKNAQHSTGPRTDEGKARSSQNSIKHGIFLTKLLTSAPPEAIAEIQELAVGLWEYYKPDGILEEILVQKIVAETARYGRILALEQLEQPESGYNLVRVVHCLDRTSRYSTSTSRSLYRAIEELERLQAARKEREGSVAAAVGEPTPVPSVANGEQLEGQVLKGSASDGNAPVAPEGGFGEATAA